MQSFPAGGEGFLKNASTLQEEDGKETEPIFRPPEDLPFLVRMASNPAVVIPLCLVLLVLTLIQIAFFLTEERRMERVHPSGP
jgi:hypothetical protein